MSELLSIVVPAFNEAPVLGEFHTRISQVLATIDMNYELIYVDDGSSDNTVALINELRERDQSIALIELSRNFGKEVALSAGLDHASGDAVVIIDARSEEQRLNSSHLHISRMPSSA